MIPLIKSLILLQKCNNYLTMYLFVESTKRCGGEQIMYKYKFLLTFYVAVA